MIQEMIGSLEYTVRFIDQSVDDLSDEEMVEQPLGVPNHATWTLGHVIHACHAMAVELGAEPWLPQYWEPTFGYGSTPRPDESVYPGKAELRRLLADAAARFCRTVRGVNPSVLGRPLPDDDLPTTGHLLLHVMVGHTAYHAGQLGMWRRAVGKEPAAVFI